MTRYPLAEKFKSIQGEGLYTGTPMAFIRLVGCSVGQGICTHCDTDFDKVYPELGGGLYSVLDIIQWVDDYHHICVTGGEPLDRNLSELFDYVGANTEKTLHLETSGTRPLPRWVEEACVGGESAYVHLTVSPKPGYREEVVRAADEVKVILGGLGDGPGWPTLEDALRWADWGLTVYLQPRNFKHIIDDTYLQRAVAFVEMNPNLRLSVQMHKVLGKR